MRVLPVILGLLAGLGPLAAEGPIARYLVTFEGLAEEPRSLTLTGLELSLEVVEFVEGNDPVVSKAPGESAATPLAFVLPEVGDEVLILSSWMRRIQLGAEELHDGTIVGYDHDGVPVARWNFENAWPSEWTLPGLTRDDSKGLADLRSTFVVQIDALQRVSLDGTAPWPKIMSIRTDRRTPGSPRFVLEWRSVADATYTLYAWDSARQRPTPVQTDIVATGPRSTATVDLEGTELLYIVLTSPPPELP